MRTYDEVKQAVLRYTAPAVGKCYRERNAVWCFVVVTAIGPRSVAFRDIDSDKISDDILHLPTVRFLYEYTACAKT